MQSLVRMNLGHEPEILRSIQSRDYEDSSASVCVCVRVCVCVSNLSGKVNR